MVVTTGYMGEWDVAAKKATDAGVYVGMLLLVALAVLFVVTRFSPWNIGPAGGREWARLTLFGAALAVMIGGILFGEAAFGLDRSANRRWLFSSVVASVCFAIVALCASKRYWLSLAAGVACFCFAAVIGIGVPEKEGAYGGAYGRNWIVMLTVVGFPAAVGLILISAFLSLFENAKDLRRGFAGFWSVSGVARGLKLGAGTVAVVTLSLLAWAVFRGGEVSPYPTGRDLHAAVIPWWNVLIFVAVLALAWFVRRARGQSLATNLGFYMSCFFLALVCLVVLFEQALAHSRYLTHYLYLGNPKVRPVLGWIAVWGMAGLCALSLLAAFLIERRKGHRSLSAPLVMPILLLLLGSAYFVVQNFLASEISFTHAVVCVDRQSGAVRWICNCVQGFKGKYSSDNSPATPTPVIDGNRVYAYFGSAGLACCDLDGNLKWVCLDVPFESFYGVACSPIVYDGMVIIQSESSARLSNVSGYLAAVDGASGKIVWKKYRPIPSNYAGNCRTPLVKEINGRKVILVWGHSDLSAYDPASGEHIWVQKLEPLSLDMVSSMVCDDERVYLPGNKKVLALAMEKLGTGDDVIAWSRDVDGLNCSSPVLANGMLFLVGDKGNAYCLEAATGEVNWTRRLRGLHYASPISVGDKVYFCSKIGVTTVVAADKTFRKLASNELNETTYASFAPLGDELIIRTTEHIYCVRGE